MKTPKWWSQIIALRLGYTFAYRFLKSRPPVLFIQSPARKWTLTRTEKPSRCLARHSWWVGEFWPAIRFLIPCFLLFMEHAYTEALQRWPKRDWLGKGWAGQVEKLDYWSRWGTIMSLVLTFHLCTSVFLSSHLSHLVITWNSPEDCCLKRCLAEMHRENGVHCDALYASPLKDA